MALSRLPGLVREGVSVRAEAVVVEVAVAVFVERVVMRLPLAGWTPGLPLG